MTRIPMICRRGLSVGTLLLACAIPGWLGTAAAPASPASQAEDVICSVDLEAPGQLSDVLSNALGRGFNKAPDDVRALLQDLRRTGASAPAMMEAASRRFQIPQMELAGAVESFRHCNCTHAGGEKEGAAVDETSAPFEMTPFARDVTLHVVLHELGHALVREFDLPILGNEETLADAFATHYLTTHLPDRAFDVLSARTRSLMIEAGEVPRADWTVSGEHNNDARRAFQIAALAVAADPAKYRPIAEAVGMSKGAIRSAADYGTEIHRSWRRVLAPLWMPAGVESNEARVGFSSDGTFAAGVRGSGLLEVLRATLVRFDWHSQVTIRFVDGEGGAGWSRSKRTISVHREYVERFVRQGRQ